MSRDQISIEGFDNIITEAVEKRVHLAISQALSEVGGDIVDKFVKSALHTKVKDGYRDIPFLEKVAKDTVREATQQAMKAWIVDATPQIRAEIERQINTKSWQRGFVTSVLSDIVNQIDGRYRFSVNFTEIKDT